MANTNILSQRYATPEMNAIFSEKGRILSERGLWIAVMKAQTKLGLDIPSEAIERYELAADDINLKRIEEIEARTRHDVKAKIEAFSEVADVDGYLHLGMTSRDLTDNVEQMQIKQASQLVFGKYVSVLRHFLDKSEEYRNILLTARTHHQPAQLTLLGRRMAMWAEELQTHLHEMEEFIENYPLRGIKGPVGTQADMLRLLETPLAVHKLEEMVAEHLGFKDVLVSPGQVYPRSLDFSLISKLSSLAAPCENYALGMRLMAGYELVTEGFADGQVGSSAMPHKMNTRSSERMWSFAELLKMYADGASRLSGQQWEEGDVSCSALRRVILPDAFYTSDGLCETTLTVLNEMGTYPVMISNEIDRYLPFLATTQILAEAVRVGMDREQAHGVIKKHAVAEALRMRDGERGGEHSQLIERLAADRLFIGYGITPHRLEEILAERGSFLGGAHKQIDTVIERADYFLTEYPEAAAYESDDIL